MNAQCIGNKDAITQNTPEFFYDKYALRIHSVKNDAEYIFLLTKSTPPLVLFMSVLKT